MTVHDFKLVLLFIRCSGSNSAFIISVTFASLLKRLLLIGYLTCMIGISFVKHEPVEHSSKMIPSLSDANSNGKSLIEVMKEKRPSLVKEGM